MTEQEKREKAIEEMAKIARNDLCNYECKICKCEYYDVSLALYNAGYRKVDKDGVFHIDISDELKKDFFQTEIKKAKKEAIIDFAETAIRCLKDDVVMRHAIKVIAHCKFGVEVEE